LHPGHREFDSKLPPMSRARDDLCR
jgi:hypothetical protein